MSDFISCKLCGAPAAPRFDLGDTVVRACARCDLHFSDFRDEFQAAAGDDGTLREEERRFMEERLPAAAAPIPWRMDLLSRYLPLPGARVLDVGAGIGSFLLRLREAGALVEGIEPSRLRRRFAKERFGLQLHGSVLESADWEGRAGAFDVLTLWEVIEHLNNPVATVRAARRLLRPGGVLALETHSRVVPAYRLSQLCYHLSGGRISLFLRNYYVPIPFGHKQIFTPAQVADLLAGNGFRLLFAGSAYPADRSPSFFRPKDKIIVVAQKTGGETH